MSLFHEVSFCEIIHPDYPVSASCVAATRSLQRSGAKRNALLYASAR